MRAAPADFRVQTGPSSPSHLRSRLSRRPFRRLSAALGAGILAAVLLPGAAAAGVGGMGSGADPDDEQSDSTTTAAVEPGSELQLTLVASLTVPPPPSGLLSAAELAEYTEPETGTLALRLDALAGRPIAVGVDPMIIASIRVLGDEAPEDALAWLQRLSLVSNELFPLAYADADAGYTVAAGGALPRAAGFDFALPAPEPVLEEESEDATEAGAEDGTGAEDAVLDPVAPGPAPLDWNYDTLLPLWPAAGSVSPSLLEAAAERLVLIETVDLVAEDARTVGARVTVEGHEAVLIDSELSELATRASTSTVNGQRSSAIARLQLELGSRIGSAPEATSVLVTLERGAPFSPAAVDELLSAITGTPGVTVRPLTALLGDSPAAEVALAAQNLDGDRVAEFRAVLAGEQNVAKEARAVETPAFVTDDQRLRALAIGSLAWVDEEARSAAVEAYLTRTTLLGDGVRLEPSSDVLLVSNQTSIPVTVSNAFSYPVTVRVDITSSSNRLLLGGPVEIVVGAESQRAAQVPVETFANGPARMTISLVALDGTALDENQTINVDIQAGWEIAAVAVLGGGAALLFVGGIIRSIMKRRAGHAELAVAIVEADARTAAEAAAPDARGGRSETGGSEHPDPDSPESSAPNGDAR